MLAQILSTYEEFGYKFLVFIGNDDEESERRYIQELLAYKIEGLIILSHTIPSMELAGLQIPIVTIEREDAYVCSVNTDNYMGGVQAASLLASHDCDILVHINSPTQPERPAYGRIQGFLDICAQKKLNHKIIYKDFRSDYGSLRSSLSEVLDELEQSCRGMKKGLFISSDTNANAFLNLLIRKYGTLPDDYLIVGFDNSPASMEAVIPISTVGQQVDKIAHEAVSLLGPRPQNHYPDSYPQGNNRKKLKENIKTAADCSKACILLLFPDFPDEISSGLLLHSVCHAKNAWIFCHGFYASPENICGLA